MSDFNLTIKKSDITKIGDNVFGFDAFDNDKLKALREEKGSWREAYEYAEKHTDEYKTKYSAFVFYGEPNYVNEIVLRSILGLFGYKIEGVDDCTDENGKDAICYSTDMPLSIYEEIALAESEGRVIL